MKITIKPEVFKKFPQLKVAFILAEGIDNKNKVKKANHLLAEMQKDTITALLYYLALKHIVPFGADNPTKIKGDITFGIKKDDLYYRDTKRVLGTKLDYWKNVTTAISPASWCALIHFEFLPPVSVAKQKEILDEAEELIKAFCGGEVKKKVLSKGKKSAIL